MKALKHLKTITTHKLLVGKLCFKLGLYGQGICHDLSKYSPTEFGPGIRYYQGTRSPNAKEREIFGYSKAWMHHKGRNKHHFEYWTDLDLKTKQYMPVRMPRRYLVEMVMDRIAACKTLTADECDAALDGIVHERWHSFKKFGKAKKMLDLSEAPQAYKDIEEVIAAELDLVEPLVRLLPMASLKG